MYTHLKERESRTLSYQEDDDDGHYDRAYSRQFNAQRLRLDQPDIVLPNMNSSQAAPEEEIVNRNENPYYGLQDNTETSAGNFRSSQAAPEEEIVHRNENPYYGSQDNTETSAGNFDMVQRTENPYYGQFTT